MLLLQQMVVLFILMGIGFFCGKKGFISDSFAKNLSWMVVNVATPAMIISSGMNEESSIKGSELGFAFLLTILVYVYLIVAALVLVPALGVPKKDRGVYRVMTIFTNIGFMGMPIIQATYGDEALLYAALFQFPFNFLIYTYGIAVLRGQSPAGEGLKLSKFLNVGVISCIIAVIIFLTGIPMPGFIKTSAKSLSGLAAPLSMMVIGQSMIHIRVKDLFGDLRLLVFSLIKLIAVPAIGVLLLKLFIRDEMLLSVCFIMLATPIGSMTAMLSQQYGGDYKTASKGVALSTVLSVITIPLISFIIF